MATLRESLVHEPNELKFGTSGLRALVTDMTDLECYINAAGFLRFLVERRELKPDGVVLLAGDLRDSTPRIMRAVAAAIRDGGYKIENCGLVPTPTISLYGFSRGVPSIMVTGSHIPADRNGIKFIKPHDEVLKGDEPSVTANVSAVRVEMYGLDVNEAQFDSSGMLKHEMVLPAETLAARELYTKRYVEVFGAKALAGKQLVFYQHSAVGRDYLADLFEQLGAEVVRVGRSDVFIPIDSENVTDQDEAYFKKLATDNSEAFAIVSTDGDSDRPFVIDAQGEFHRGDVLGAVVAEWLKADFAAFPVSTIDAVDKRLTSEGVIWKHTKIGSPYVISCMKEAIETGKSRAVGWEVNGGFLLGSDLEVGGKILRSLPTRDAFIAILVALLSASESGKTVSQVFAELPQRFSQAGLIDNFPVDVSRKMLQHFSEDTQGARHELERYFTPARGFGAISSLNLLDGIRIYFDNGDVAHLRPSNNAPQLRIYSAADSQNRANEIVDLALAEPDGIFREMQRALGSK